MSNYPTQHDLILQYIKDFGSITPLEAFAEFNITKLSTRIGEMREKGIDFNTEIIRTKPDTADLHTMPSTRSLKRGAIIMAEKRMFTKKIVDSDAFLDMPLSTQALYFHLNMRADDDGFVNNPKRIQRTIGASDDDLKLLIAKRFLICFDNGIIVIKHWRMHNALRKDRYRETQYNSQMSLLEVKENGAYTEKKHSGNQMATSWQPNGNQMATQYSVGKYSLGEDSVVVVEGNGNQNCDYTDPDNQLIYFKGKVMLSENQIADLLEKMGLEAFDEYVDRLNNWLNKPDVQYVKSHYETILKWYNEDRCA
jgi:hypothetical protein